MPGLRPVALIPVVCVVLMAAALPSAQGAQRALPSTVVVHDSRTSAPIVDIAKVALQASWYYDSEQYVRVTVPHGFRPGHDLTVYFDLNGDSTPDGHYDLKLREPKRAGGQELQMTQEFRLGGGWDDAGKRVPCGDGQDFPPASDIRRGQRTVFLGFNLWLCLQVPTPGELGSGSWRVAVRVAKGKNADMAPNHRGWSKPVAGWEPCDPADGGQCP
jgi:hypothetical protein